ncbi:hypothetical protein TNCV_2963681 [Trichonephila clavipes]|nr:hypothetical protein TNCV_2963681 [Trichonephila clavipes]
MRPHYGSKTEVKTEGPRAGSIEVGDRKSTGRRHLIERALGKSSFLHVRMRRLPPGNWSCNCSASSCRHTIARIFTHD